MVMQRLSPSQQTVVNKEADLPTPAIASRNKFMTIRVVSEPQRLSFLGTSFQNMNNILMRATGQLTYPVRLEKDKHMEGVKWALASCGDAYEPWQQIHDALDRHGSIEVHVQD